jgi:hypothetical protein
MSVSTYDPQKVVLTIGGAIMGGFADGTFITAQREGDSFTKVTGADGRTSRAKSSDKSGNVVLTLLQTSPSNDVLSAIIAADEISGAGVVPLICKDAGGTTILFSGTAWIRKPANVEFGKEITNREWTIDVADFSMIVGSNSAV